MSRILKTIWVMLITCVISMSAQTVSGFENPKFETGEVTLDDSLSWTTVNLVNSYTSTVVIFATPVTAANCEAVGACAGNSTGGGGGMYPIPLIRNVSNTSFDIAMCVDGGSTTCDVDPGVDSETFHWFAFDPSDTTSYDWIEVGTTTGVDVGGVSTAETFTTSFTGTPDVWVQAQTYSQGSNIGATAWVDPKSTSGFSYIGCVHTGVADVCDGTATDETFGYLAINVAGEDFPAAVNFQSGSANILNSVWTTANFSPTYYSARAMVTQNDDDGGQDPQYAWARDITASNMEFRYCEEDSGTTCNTHTDEVTHWFTVEGTNLIEISGSSDLVDSTSVSCAKNGADIESTTISSSAYSITMSVPFASGDVITCWADDVTNANETTAVTVYDGTGNVTGMDLNAHVLHIGSSDNATVTLSDLGQIDQTGDEDIMYTVSGGTLTVDGTSAYTDEELEIQSGNTLSITGTQEIVTLDMDLNGVLTVTATGYVEINGDWDATGGTFNPGNSTTVFNGSSNHTITDDEAFYHIEFNNSAGTWELQDTLNVDGTLLMVSGTLDTKSGVNNTINVDGNWTVTGTFVPRQGLVNLSGGDQAITTSGTFYNLQKTVTTSGTLTFEAGITVEVTNNLTFDGAPGQYLGLISSTPSTAYNLDVRGGNQQVSYVNVSDSEALSNDILAVLSINGGGNDDADVPPTDQWIFLNERYWVGPANGDTSDPNNWSGSENLCTVGGGAGVPTTLEVAIFSDTCTNSAVVDATLNPGGVTIESSYTGTIRTDALLDIDGPLTMEDGTLDLDTNDTNINISGNVLVSGGTYTAGTGILTLDGVQTFTDSVGGTNFGNVTVNGTASVVTLSSSLTVEDLTISGDDTMVSNGYDVTVNDDITISGVLNANLGDGGSTDINVTGNWDMTSGTFSNANSTVVFEGTSNVTTGTSSFNNVSIGSTTSGATVTTLDNFDVNGSLTVTNAAATTLDISNDTMLISANLDFANLDTFTVTNAIVRFDGSGVQTIASDSKTYNDIEVTNSSSGGVSFTEAFTTTDFTNTTASSVMKFQQSTTFTINGDLTLQGQSGSFIEIDSVDGATQFTFNVASDQDVVFLDVHNSAASTSDITASSSINGGGNDDGDTPPTAQWIFITITPTLYEDDGDVTQIAFNHIRQNSTTPTFRASATNGAFNFNRFQLELNTASDFSGTSYTQTFSGTYVSNTQYNLFANSLSPSLPTTDGATYYVRVRASADGGSTWGIWSSDTSCCATWTFTYKSAVEIADWFQTTSPQFLEGTLADLVTTGTNSVRLGGGFTDPIFETGTVTFDDSLDWTTIYFASSYTTVPVVLATPVTAANCEAVGACAGNSVSGGGGMYPLPLVRNVTTTSFEMAMCVDGGSAACDTDPGVDSETFNWFAFDIDDAENYAWIEVGRTTNVAVDGTGTSETYSTSFLATPDVWTQAQTYSQAGDIGAQAWVTPKSAGGFTYVGCVHTGALNDCDGTATNETFGYVAINVAAESFPAGVGFQSSSASISNSVWTAASFSPSFTTPRVMVTQNSEGGAEDPQYPWARNVITTGMDFRFCEQDDGTTCNTHAAETVHWFSTEQSPPVTTGTFLSSSVSFANAIDTTTWNEFNWSEVEVSGSMSVQLYYTDTTTCDTLVPNGDLAGNFVGFNSGPIDISGLNTTTYNELCLYATLDDGGSSDTPYLDDWTISWVAAVPQTYTWNGNGDGVSWEDEANWDVGDGTPGNDGYPDDDFDSALIDSTNDNITTAGTLTIADLRMEGAYGGTLTMSGTTSFTVEGTGVLIDAGTLAVGNLLDINGTLTLGATLNTLVSNGDMNVFGSITVNTGGSVVHGTGTMTIDGDMIYTDNVGGTNFGNVTVSGTTQLATDFTADFLHIQTGHLFETDGYEMDLSGTMSIEGTLNADSGTDGSSIINVGGGWDMTGGSFVNTSSTVVFDGTSLQTVTTSTGTFIHVEITNTGTVSFIDATEFTDFTNTTASSGMVFNAGSTYTINGTLTLNGQATGTRIIIDSSDSATRFNFIVSAGPQSVEFIDVANSQVSGTAGNDIRARNSVASGNTDRLESSPKWSFGPLRGSVIIVD